MNKILSRIIGILMFVLSIAFVMFAFNHPEMSFPWSNTITYLLYGLYIIVMIVMLIAPFKNINRISKQVKEDSQNDLR